MKLLLIMPNFFRYPKIISNELSKMGYEVDFYDDRPSTNPFMKAFIRINKNLVRFSINRYFKRIYKEISEKKYDVFLLISGQSLSLSPKMIEKIKLNQPQAKFLLYQWDSESNFPYVKLIQGLFDKCFSFDKDDVSNNPSLKFLPLFYWDMYEQIGKDNKVSFDYDFSFIGTAHPKKYEFIRRIENQLKPVYPKQFIYLFLPSRIVYIYRKMKNPEYRHAKYKEFHYTPLHNKQIKDIFIRSKCILDSAQANQKGLTIRVLEALGAKKKIITTNEDVVNYDFYRPENIYIYKGEVDFDDVFFKSDYVDIDQRIYEKYSLRNWLRQMIGE